MDTISALFEALHADYYESDDTYAENLQLQEALEASLYMQSTSEASSSQLSCEICTEDKESHQMFQIQGCPHSFCSACISSHVLSKLGDNIIKISCLSDDCENVMELESLRSLIPSDVAARWENQLSESTILSSQKYYCPYTDCRELLIDDEDDEGDIITESECPYCRRLFCAQCKVPWHDGLSCEEFERDVQDDGLRLLVEENNWQACPECGAIVEKIDGCRHIVCR